MNRKERRALKSVDSGEYTRQLEREVFTLRAWRDGARLGQTINQIHDLAMSQIELELAALMACSQATIGEETTRQFNNHLRLLKSAFSALPPTMELIAESGIVPDGSWFDERCKLIDSAIQAAEIAVNQGAGELTREHLDSVVIHAARWVMGRMRLKVQWKKRD